MHYHRNDDSGRQRTSMGEEMTFRSLRDDFANLRATAPAGVVDSGILNVGQSENGRDLHAIRIGKNPAMPVLIAGCHHAREWISVEVPYLIAEYLVTRYASDPQVQRIVDARDIWIVPMINPDGHEHSVLTDRLWRKNRPPAGDPVDLNRHYATARWRLPAGEGHFSDDPASDIFRGANPAEAAEVQAMQALIDRRQFKGSLDYHSRGRFFLYPYAGRAAAPPDVFQERMTSRLETIVDAHGNDYQTFQASEFYVVTQGHSARDARVPGAMMDYVVENVSGSIAITVELEPDISDPRSFILPESEIGPTFDLHRGSILAFLNCVDNLQDPPDRHRLELEEDPSQSFRIFHPDCGLPFASY